MRSFFLNIMICRMGDGFYVQPMSWILQRIWAKNMRYPKIFLRRSDEDFLLKLQMKRSSIFALYLKGQGNNRDSDTITPEMNKFITEAFAQIKEKFLG